MILVSVLRMDRATSLSLGGRGRCGCIDGEGGRGIKGKDVDAG